MSTCTANLLFHLNIFMKNVIRSKVIKVIRRRKLNLTFKLMIDPDKTFGPHGERCWPGNESEAKILLQKAPGVSHSRDIFEDDDFFHPIKSDEELWPFSQDEAWELGKKRREVFSGLEDWPLPLLVLSAFYKVLDEETKRVGCLHFSTWSRFFDIFLVF